MANVGISSSMSLVSFAKSFSKMQRGMFTNEQTGETFASCIFTKEDGTRTFVSFSSKLGELSAKEIAEQKYDLQVVQLESGNFKLCKKGNPGESWEDIEL